MSHEGTMQEATRALLPFMDAAQAGPLSSRVEGAPLSLLRRFYLFSVSGLVAPKDESDLAGYIERRFLGVLSAAHQAGWTVVTAAVGSAQGVEILLGFMTQSWGSESDPYVFERILRGLLPGLRVEFKRSATIEPLLKGKPFGGLLAGVPALRVNDERQRFSLPAVLKGLHGEDYALFMISSPVEPRELARQLREVWAIKDSCHRLGQVSRNTTRGGSDSFSQSTTHGISRADSRYGKAGVGAVGGAILGGAFAGPQGAAVGGMMGASLLLSASGQTTRNTSTTSSSNRQREWSESLTFEEQNSVALELARLAERQAERFMKATNVGEWETTITFATKTQEGRDILAGTLLGEMARPSTEIFPPRVFYDKLNSSRPLLLPGKDKLSSLFPRGLASYLTGEELAAISAPPPEQLPGYEVRQSPSFGLGGLKTRSQKSEALGIVCDHGRPLEGLHIDLSPADLSKHLFVCGLTGTGKTTTVKELVTRSPVPFLVLESAKRDYRQLLGVEELRDLLKIYTVGDTSISPLSMNPFYVLPGVSALSHIDFLKALFNASFSLYGPMPYILEKCIHNLYLKRGWNLSTGRHPYFCAADGSLLAERYKDEEALHLFPTLIDLKNEVQHYVKSTLEYRGELSDNIRTAIVTRLESLSVGAKGQLFGAAQPLDIEALLESPTVFELEALSDDDDKAFFVGLILTFISEYRQVNNPAINPYAPKKASLSHLLVIEEAHRLLKNVSQERQSDQLGNPRGKAVEFFANVISEMRALGQGVVVVEQIPSKILPDVVKNTNTKIVHRIVAGDDQALMASSLGMTPDEALYLSSLSTGHALYMKEGMQRAVEMKVNNSLPSIRISHERVRRSTHSKSSQAGLDSVQVGELRSVLGNDGELIAIKWLCSLLAHDRISPDELTELTLRGLERLITAKERSVSQDILRKYLAERVGALLVQGHFRVSPQNLSGSGKLLHALISGESHATDKFRALLMADWNTECLENGLILRLRELVLEQALNARDSNVQLSHESFTASLFQVQAPFVQQRINTYVLARLGGMS